MKPTIESTTTSTTTRNNYIIAYDGHKYLYSEFIESDGDLIDQELVYFNYAYDEEINNREELIELFEKAVENRD